MNHIDPYRLKNPSGQDSVLPSSDHLKSCGLVSRVKFSVWPVFLWSPNFETDPHPQVFQVLVISEMSDLTYSTISHNYSIIAQNGWDYLEVSGLVASQQVCRNGSIGNRKRMCLSSVFGFPAEFKQPWPRLEATTTACWQRWAIRTTSSQFQVTSKSISWRDSFQVFLLLMSLETQIPRFNMTKRGLYSKICQQTIQHLDISTFPIFHHQISLLKVDRISTLDRYFW